MALNLQDEFAAEASPPLVTPSPAPAKSGTSLDEEKVPPTPIKLGSVFENEGGGKKKRAKSKKRASKLRKSKKRKSMRNKRR